MYFLFFKKAIAFYMSLCYYNQAVNNDLRMWRNWQTQQTQNLPMVTSWGFDSLHPHFK